MALLGAAVIIGATLAVTAPADSAAAACSAGSKPESAAASALARTCHKRVSVSGATTSMSTLVANSDGSFTTTESTVPERVRRADGTWAAVDLTLKSNGDGTISPAASPTAVVLSDGGAGPLARTVSGSQELVWTWTGYALPKPSIGGAVATYGNVLPDVDLKVLVDEWGFSEVLVVKTRDAAANPKLASLKFALSGSGLSAAGAAGTATAPQDAVSAAFEISPAHMWDSTVPPQTSAGMPAADVTAETKSTFEGPGDAAKVSTLPTTMSGTSLVVTPDQTLLTDPSANFPIYIDPKSTSPARTYWAMINKGHPSQEYWDYDRSSHAKVGNAGDGTNMYRSLFQFSTSVWKGKHVTKATFSDNIVHSWTCSNTTTELHHVAQGLSSSVTWNSDASLWDSASLASVSNQNCDDSSGVGSEFSSSALTLEIEALRGNATVTLGLRASSETISTDGSNGWKKFDETSGSGGAHLSVTYNTAPVLSSLHTDGGTCATTASAAPVLTTVGSHNPVPQATVTDAEADKSTVTFTYPKAGGGTSSLAYSNIASGTSQKLVGGIPYGALTSGTTYSWTVTASDGTDSSSATCYFKVDNTVAQPPTIVTADGRYPDTVTDATPHDGVGKPGTFTITATGTAAQIASVVKYQWGSADGGSLTTVTTTSGAPVTVSYTPIGVGDTTLIVYAVTSTGIQSGQGNTDFMVADADAEVGHWALDGDGADAGSGAHTATASNVTWTANARQIGHSVANFNGTSAALTATRPIDTNTSFSVAAWLRPSVSSCTTNAIGQDGTHTSGFYLGCYSGKFTFDVIGSDSASVASTRTSSTAAAPANVWSYVVGVYDLSANKISLYVNGVLQGTNTLAAPLWDATGSFVIGRQRYNDINGSWWIGDISDVHVWDRVVYPVDIAAVMNNVTWADQYPLNDLIDPTVDSHNSANALTWHGSPTPAYDDMNPPGSGGTQATGLNTADPAYALSAGPSVRTDGSFSVSAWVNPATVTSAYTNAVAQNGTVTANFGLGLSSTGYYDFWMHGSDVAVPTATVVSSTTAATAGQWVNLIATFDFTTKVMSLYINGELQNTATFSGAPWQATGPLAIGTGLWNSAPGYFWNGGIDNVGMFNGVLDSTQIANLYQYNNPFYVPDGETTS